MRGWLDRVRSVLLPHARTSGTVLALLAVAGGALIGGCVLGDLTIGDLWGYALHGKESDPDGVGDRLSVAMGNILFVVAFGLILLGCAVLYRLWASSRFGRLLAEFVITAVVVSVAAEVAGRLLGANPSSDALVIEAVSAVKWSTLFVALIGVPATIGIFLRGLMGWYRSRVWRRKRRRAAEETQSPPQAKQQWWEAARADSDFPVVQVMSAANAEQSSWRKAYNVPGASAILRERQEKEQPVQALCLSGGGVRSACVAMGAMQILSEHPAIGATSEEPPARLIDDIDYVISVSGGGYSAGARLLAVQSDDPPAKWFTPSAKRTVVAKVSQRFQPGSAEFDHLRRGSSFIADSPGGLLSALLQILKNLVASLVTIFTVPVIVGWVAGWVLAVTAIAAFPPVPSSKTDHTDPFASLSPHPGSYVAIAGFIIAAIVFTMLALLVEWAWWGRLSDCCRTVAAKLARASFAFSALIGVVTVVLPGLMYLCWWAVDSEIPTTSSVVASVSGIVGLNFVAAVVAIVWGNKSMISFASATEGASLLKRTLPPAVLRLLLIIATLTVLLVVWLALLGCFAAGVFHFNTKAGGGLHVEAVPNWEWWLPGLFAAAVFIGFADVTSLSLHPFYRRRLARTFAVRRAPGNVRKPFRAKPYPDNEHTWLHTHGSVCGGPKFVFAAAAAISGTDKPAPGLNATSFVMSADCVGGPELGWFKTEELWEASPPRIKRDLTVEAAVAISGAAIASTMGRQNRGFEKLLAVSGARLGTWLPNPQFVQNLAEARGGQQRGWRERSRAWPMSLPTIRGAGYLYREILGINEKHARLVQVTDGGHYDNSGLVEALRRRSRLILCIDGGGDSPPLASGLADAIRLARYELGVEIELKKTGPHSTEDIAPGSGAPFEDDHALVSLNDRLTRGTVVLGTIEYPDAAGLDATTGLLIFGKAVLSDQCPYWLLTYAACREGLIFPHDPTTDQWFNEAQFAAYTELGRIIAGDAMQCVTELYEIAAQDAASGPPSSSR